MTPQSTFMITATIQAGRTEALRRLLATMNRAPGHADPDNALVPFARFDRLHMARFTILEARTSEDSRRYGIEPYPWRPILAFLGDFDGDRDAMLAPLAEQAGPGLRRIFAHCEDGPDEATDLLAWMKARNVEPKANYVNWLGRTVRQVREEQALHESLRRRLAEIVDEVGRDHVRQLRQKLLSHVEMEKHEGRLTLTPPEPTPRDWLLAHWTHKLAVPLGLLLISPLLLLALPFLALRLRMLERSDPEIFIRPDPEHHRRLGEQEDIDVTNQFNVFGDVKPGPFRRCLLQFALLLLDYTNRHVYNRGFLTRVKTIHFARWVMLDGDRRIFFASNYDGSQEAYMDDFINKVAWGLNLVFSNGVGYPRTRWLIKEGARREQVYKYTLRRHQLPSEVWYKAYPDLTAQDLWRNQRIRAGVEFRPADDAALREWLSLI